MKFETLGNKDKPAVLLIHGMFCNADSVKHFATYLQDDFYLIIPTLSGHYEDSNDYLSKEKEAGEILNYLHKNEIGKLVLVQGTSMGAEIALEFARIADIPIEHYFFDGGPFFVFSKWLKVLMRKKFQGFVKICRGKNEGDAFQSLTKNFFVKRLLGKERESYKAMLLDFTKVCNHISDNTIRNLVETCYACKLPEFKEEIQKKFIFFFSEKEPAHMSKKRLLKAYHFADFRDIPNLGHCGFQVVKPREYAEYLRKIVIHKES